uniref:Uncharacterized protein n=1 Tax=Arundo donax TaxID=35708 RepID=A0A0A8Z6I9_ARUDO
METHMDTCIINNNKSFNMGF